MRIAVWFDQKEFDGGGYYAALSVVDFLNKCDAGNFEFLVFGDSEIKSSYSRTGIVYQFFTKTWRFRLDEIIIKVLPHILLRWLLRLGYKSRFEQFLNSYEIHFVHFLSSSPVARHLFDLPFSITVWDLAHRSESIFPEVGARKVFESRECFYRAVLPRSQWVFVDSDLNKRRLSSLYGLLDEKLKVIPFTVPFDILRQRPRTLGRVKNYREEFIFYPANFWPHKNHKYVIDVVARLRTEYGLSIRAVFTGLDCGSEEFVRRNVKARGLEQFIDFKGWLNRDEIEDLYNTATCLLMPSFFGPTNLPPLEAFALGCPVLYPSDEGFSDFAGDACLLFDRADVDSACQHVGELVGNVALKKSLIDKGFAYVARFEHANPYSDLLACFGRTRLALRSFKDL